MIRRVSSIQILCPPAEPRRMSICSNSSLSRTLGLVTTQMAHHQGGSLPGTIRRSERGTQGDILDRRLPLASPQVALCTEVAASPQPCSKALDAPTPRAHALTSPPSSDVIDAGHFGDELESPPGLVSRLAPAPPPAHVLGIPEWRRRLLQKKEREDALARERAAARVAAPPGMFASAWGWLVGRPNIAENNLART